MKRLIALGLTAALTAGIAPVAHVDASTNATATGPGERIAVVVESTRIEAGPAPIIGIADVEDALPPVARNVLGVIRVIKGIGSRNRVYREARSVQRELRGYYDAQLQTARTQLENRSQLGLNNSQVRAYVRVYERLVAERQFALAITEDEKRVAKYGFEAKLKSEITAALVRTPRFRRGLERAREAVQEVRGAFDQARAAIEGGNPITAALDDVKRRITKLERNAEIASMVLPGVGNALGNIAGEVREQVDRAEAAVDEAANAARSAMGELEAVSAGLDESLAAGRTERAETAMNRAAEELFDRVFTPKGEEPERDVVADAVARNTITARQRNVGVALGAIDPSDFRRMRDRVSAAMLGNTLERISDLCGRVIGEARRLQMAAAAAGEAPPDTSTPCELFGNPEALQALLDAGREPEESDDDENADETESDDGAGAVDSPTADPEAEPHPADGTYSGVFSMEELQLTGGVNDNRVEVTVEGGVPVSLDGAIEVVGDCEEGGGPTITLTYDVSGTPGTALAPEPPFVTSLAATFTIAVIGRCPESENDWSSLSNDILDDFDGLTVSGTATLTFGDGSADAVFSFDNEADMLNVALTRS